MSAPKDVVLVVDDDPSNILVMSQTLRPDHDVLFATDAHKALALAVERQPDLILLDVLMPQMDGYELCRRLKAEPRTTDIPVVFITSLEQAESEVEGLQCGAVDYIPKPFNPPVVRARVHNHLEIVRSRRRLRQYNRQLEETGRMVAAGIRYASRIQGAMLPDLRRLDGLVAETAVLWKPLDVVGGDFYWAGLLGDKVVFALIDCTGHGVPGAFMAVVAAASLAQVMRDNRDGDPANMLAAMNQAFRTLLQQDEGGPAADDGFDAALCVLDPERRHLCFAGANMHLLIADAEGIKRIRGDRVGLGYATAPAQARLTKHQISLAEGSVCHLFTDGVVDNMGGGERPQLFGWRRLADVLERHRTRPLSDHIDAVTSSLANWCGDQPQRDDMTLLAFRP